MLSFLLVGVQCSRLFAPAPVYTVPASPAVYPAFAERAPEVVRARPRSTGTSGFFPMVAVPVVALAVYGVAQRATNSRASIKMADDMAELKKQVGYKSVDDFVTSDTVVGLGTGSTAYFAVERVGSKLTDGSLEKLVCIPTSEQTFEQATDLKIPLATLDEHGDLAVCIDGADAVDANGNLVKGGGGALLREKMVAARADEFIVIVDESKLTDKLGSSFPLPVEVVPFCAEHTKRVVAALPSVAGSLDHAEMRQRDGKDYFTDNGNKIVDLYFKDPYDPEAVGAALEGTVGVVEHGLFLGMTTTVIVAGKDGVYSIDHSDKKK